MHRTIKGTLIHGGGLLLLVTLMWSRFAPSAQAAAVTWDGGGVDELWSTCANWTGDVCPTSVDSVTFDGTSTKSVTIDAPIEVATLTLAAGYTGTLTQSSGATITVGTGGYSQAAGTFTGASGAAVTINGGFTLSGGTFTAPSSANTSVSGAWVHTAGGTFTPNGGTVRFYGSSSVAINVAFTETFAGLTIEKSGGDLTIASGDVLVATGTTTFTSGRVMAGSRIEARGNVVLESGYTAGGTATLVFGGGSTQTLTIGSGASSVYDGDIRIETTGGSTVQLSGGALTLDAANQDLVVREGVLDLHGNAVTVTGSGTETLVVEDGGTLQMYGDETITTDSASYPQLDSGSTVSYTGTSAAYTLKDYTYHHLTIAGGSSSVFTLAADESIAGNLTITSGTLSQGGRALTIVGTFSNTGTLRRFQTETFTGTMDVDSGTVEYVGDNDGVAETVIVRDFSTLSTDYYHLTINDVSAVSDIFTLGANLQTAGTLTLTDGEFRQVENIAALAALTVAGGTYTGDTGTLSVTGNLTLSSGALTLGSGAVSLAGDVTVSGGTMDPGTTTTTLTGGSQAFSGATTWYNLVKTVSSAYTLTLPAEVATIVEGNASLAGGVGGRLSLRSSVSGTRAMLSVGGVATASRLDVKDVNSSQFISCYITSGCLNSGNNLLWIFAPDTDGHAAPRPPRSTPAINVTAPTGGEAVTVGEVISISWTEINAPEIVNIMYSEDEGITWQTLVERMQNVGSYAWQIPENLVNTSVLVRVTASDLITRILDVSGPFAIYAADDASGSEDTSETSDTSTEEETSPDEAQPQDDGASEESAAPEETPVSVISPRSLVKLPDDGDAATTRDDIIYYISEDGHRHAFPNAAVLKTWYPETADVQVVTPEALASSDFGKNVTYRPGNTLIKFESSSNVYTIDSSGALRWIVTEEVARALYGDTWNADIEVVSDGLYGNYSVGSVILDPSAYKLEELSEEVSSPEFLFLSWLRSIVWL